MDKINEYINEGNIQWLSEGDISIKYQTCRDLLENENKDLQDRILSEGWGQLFVSKRNTDGHRGDRFYQPKWGCE